MENVIVGMKLVVVTLKMAVVGKNLVICILKVVTPGGSLYIMIGCMIWLHMDFVKQPQWFLPKKKQKGKGT